MKNFSFLVLTAFLFTIGIAWAQPASPLTVIDATSPNACDGSAAITNPNNVLINTIVWYSNGAIFAQGVTSISNLCPGTYGVYYATFIDSVSATFLISGNPCNGLQAIVTGTPASSPTAFDGSANVTALGGLAPYTFTWNNGATTSTITGLGVGTYYACVTDMNGCVSCDSFIVSATVNPGNDTILLINNNNIPNVIDSLGSQQIIDCSIDYNAIGAAFISGSQYVPSGNPNALDSIYLTWQVYDTMVPANLMASYVVGYSLFPPLAQAYTASLSIHCPQKNTNYNTLLIIDQFYSSQLGLSEMQNGPQICMNEACASLGIMSPIDGTCSIYSITGNLLVQSKVSHHENKHISISDWASGVYLLNYTYDNGTSGTLRFFKP